MAYRGVDLDGTLAFYPPPRGQEIGPPVPKMLTRVKKWLAAGEEVRIVTARVAHVPGATDPVRDLESCLRQRELIEAWCEKHLGQKIPVGASKDFGMSELWDDRAVQVVTNTGCRVDGCSD